MDGINKCRGDLKKSSIVTDTFDICSSVPTLKELKASFKLLRKAVVVHSNKDFWGSDSAWMSNIENSRYGIVIGLILMFMVFIEDKK